MHCLLDLSTHTTVFTIMHLTREEHWRRIFLEECSGEEHDAKIFPDPLHITDISIQSQTFCIFKTRAYFKNFK